MAALVRYDFRVGDATLATGIALLAGVVLRPGAAAASQALALPAILLLSAPGPAGTPLDWGYPVGRIALAPLVSALVGPDARAGRPRIEMGLVGALAGGAAIAAWGWRDSGFLDLRSYYLSVTALGLIVAFYYALRLVERPRRVLSMLAALTPYYALGMLGAALAARVGATSAGTASDPVDLLFHGLLVHLPGDVLMAVLVAFFTGPKPGRAGPESR